ncbi:hypothetical protein [uncultured Sneathiella sp.]|uniref:hypothetical protein n=1 Tax=uncultured Sneathiella sp. TaxID=879315 RepID=UPI0030EF3A9F|tara:strand:- start:15743 stop:16210 length:468 start_codon:yes stop_codon:yes gene_type:complete
MGKRLFVAMLLTALIAGVGTVGAFDAASGADPFAGRWRVAEVRAAGVHTMESFQEAEALIGSTLSVAARAIRLPDGTFCARRAAEKIILRDDMQTFGSAGGSWRRIGLEASAERQYHVLQSELDCPRSFNRLLAQPRQGVFLIGYNEVYILLAKL